ncbi:MAG: hypothetical protein QOK15_327 [Nocardioidaceae bacterium]|jgi:hypothetical protein|nr:hypothetical protein [Nocardioidaceae bacterium]
MIAFLVIAALFVVTVLLWLSMRKHLGRIRIAGPEDEARHGPARGAAPEPPARGAAPEPPARGEQGPRT